MVESVLPNLHQLYSYQPYKVAHHVQLALAVSTPLDPRAETATETWLISMSQKPKIQKNSPGTPCSAAVDTGQLAVHGAREIKVGRQEDAVRQNRVGFLLL